jgi:hypothetical protein
MVWCHGLFSWIQHGKDDDNVNGDSNDDDGCIITLGETVRNGIKILCIFLFLKIY